MFCQDSQEEIFNKSTKNESHPSQRKDTKGKKKKESHVSCDLARCDFLWFQFQV